MMDMSRDEVRAILKHKMKDISDAQSADLSLRLTQLCDRTGFNLAFVLSVIESESRFRPSVVSNRGAVGLMQLQPTTATFIAPMAGINHAITAQELKNPVLNVTLGVHYLAHLKARFGDSTQVLSAYNMGPAKVQSLRVRARGLAKFSKVRAYVTAIHAGESTIRNQGRKLAHAI
jgi:soluble lytic murein transglycosylase-like protein